MAVRSCVVRRISVTIGEKKEKKRREQTCNKKNPHTRRRENTGNAEKIGFPLKDHLMDT